MDREEQQIISWSAPFVIWLIGIPLMIRLLFPVEWQFVYFRWAMRFLFGGSDDWISYLFGGWGVGEAVIQLFFIHLLLLMLALGALASVAGLLWVLKMLLLDGSLWLAEEVRHRRAMRQLTARSRVSKSLLATVATGLVALSVLGVIAIDIRPYVGSPGALLIIGQCLGLAVASAFVLLHRRPPSGVPVS